CFGFLLFFEIGHLAQGFCDAAVTGEPAGTFGHAEANPPHEYRAYRSDQNDPAPAIKAEWRKRHELPREECDHGNDGELNGLVDREDPAAMRLGHQLREVGIDRDQFDTDA